MSDPNPNPASGGVPPKPADAAKVQPKKETVRITLPPKAGGRPTSSAQIEAAGKTAAVPETKLAGSASSINLVVPQVKETESSVKIPGAVEAQATAAAPMQTGPKFTPPSAPITNFEPPKSGVASVSLASKAAAPAAAAPAAPAPIKSKPSTASSSAKTNVVDVALAFLAAAACIAFVVRVYLLLQQYSS